MKKIYEIFRKTLETFIFISINLEKNLNANNININIPFVKHMINQIFTNSGFNINLLIIGDNYIDYHHIIEDLAIVLGLSLKYSIINKNLKRFGYSNVIMEESKSLVVCDISNRSYLNYNVFYNRLYIGNLDVDLFYDFFLSFTNNFKINLFILSTGYNIHHKIECIFKCLGLALKKALSFKENFLSTKGLL